MERNSSIVLLAALCVVALAACAGGEDAGSLFVGPGAPPVTAVSAAAAITENAAILNGDVTPNGISTQAWFEYGTDPALSSYASTAEQSIGEALTRVSVSHSLSGVAASSTYYFRVCAKNAKGTTRSAITSFTTASPGAAPTVATLAATSVSATGATLNANVIPNGSATEAWFEWGPDPTLAASSSTTTQFVGSNTTSRLISASLTGLTTGITYYYRVAANNSTGSSTGAIASFLAGAPPSVTTLAATSVSAGAATVNGNVNPNGLATDVWFEWGTDPTLVTSSSTATQSAGSGTTAQLMSTSLTGLTLRTTYYYRIAAANSTGTSRGQIGGFTTSLVGGSIQGLPLSLTGAVSTIAGTARMGSTDGTGMAAKFYGPLGVASDGTNLFVADTGNHIIRKVVIATREVTTLAGSAGDPGSADGVGTAARFIQPRAIATDGTNVFVIDGSYPNYRLRKMVIATGAVTTLPGLRCPVCVTTDGTNVYVGDREDFTINRVVIATGAVTTLAGTKGLPGSADGIGTAASFCWPSAITTDGTSLYLTEYGNNTVRKVVIATGEVTTLAGTAGTGGSSDGIGPAARFESPFGIAMDGTNLYVADEYNNTIRKVVIATAEVTTLAGAARIFSGADDGVGPAASFSAPRGVATDGTHLYVADSENDAIRRVAIATAEVTYFPGVRSDGSADGIGAAARFKWPSGITTDGTNLYVADQMNQTIRKAVIATGEVTTLAGVAGAGGSADGTGPAARFSLPADVTTDGINLYLTDLNAIRKVAIATGEVTTLAGSSGVRGSTDGIGPAARFGIPRGITMDGPNLYVADTGNCTVRKVVIATGEVTTLAGVAGTGGSIDGIGPAARFRSPTGITTDGTNLYVTDLDGHTIRKIDIATGAVTTLAGMASSYGSVDGTGPAARFEYPNGITTDGTNLYIADQGSAITDTGGQTIRKMVLATSEVTTLAGRPASPGSTDGIGAAARFRFPFGITTDGNSLFVAEAGNNILRKIQ